MANFIYESIDILATEPIGTPEYWIESAKIKAVLEDANSPVTAKFQEKIYNQILKKGHIDFGNIPKSAGDIKKYSGYNTMVETLDTINNLAKIHKADNVQEYVKIVKDAIKNISDLSSTYQKGFDTKTEYVALEYDTYVYFCVEATTALLYSFVDVMKDPSKQLYQLTIKNNKLRADEFYFDTLNKFNMIQNKMGIDYRQMLEKMCQGGKDNFIGIDVAIGIGAIVAVALSIIPITREVIYQIYNFRGKIADTLETQANFLELNKACVKNNEVMTADKKKKVIAKQEKLAKKFRELSDKIRVKSAKSIIDSKREINKDNKNFNVDDIKDEISDSPLELF